MRLQGVALAPLMLHWFKAPVTLLRRIPAPRAPTLCLNHPRTRTRIPASRTPTPDPTTSCTRPPPLHHRHLHDAVSPLPLSLPPQLSTASCSAGASPRRDVADADATARTAPCIRQNCRTRPRRIPRARLVPPVVLRSKGAWPCTHRVQPHKGSDSTCSWRCSHSSHRTRSTIQRFFLAMLKL